MPLTPTGKAARCLGLLLMLQLQSFAQTRQPVISKVEFIFSMVSHYNHLGERINFYNTAGSPAGNTNYAVPHLVYEPVVTLYNPYNEALTLTKARVKISDPPVGFTFKKNNVFHDNSSRTPMAILNPLVRPTAYRSTSYMHGLPCYPLPSLAT